MMMTFSCTALIFVLLSVFAEAAAGLKGPLTVSVRPWKQAALVSTEVVHFPTLVTIHASDDLLDSAETRPRVGCVIVLDVSGSMNEDGKLETAQKMVHFLATQMLSSGDYIGLVAFNHGSKVVAHPLDVGIPKDLFSLVAATYRLNAEGGTNIEDGLDLGFAALQTMPHHLMRLSVLLLSDGQANNGLQGARALSQHAAKTFDEIAVHTIAIGSNVDSGTMRAIAESTHGVMVHAATSKEIPRVFGILSAITTSVVATDIEIYMMVNEFTQEPLKVREKLVAGAKRDKLMNVTITECGPDDASIVAIVTYTDASTKAFTRRIAVAETKISCVWDPETFHSFPPDRDVLAQMHRMKAVKVLEEARKLCASGNFKACQEKLLEEIDELVTFDPSGTDVELKSLVDDLAKAMEVSGNKDSFDSQGQHIMLCSGHAHTLQMGSTGSYASSSKTTSRAIVRAQNFASS